jgi:hypothetical protein
MLFLVNFMKFYSFFGILRVRGKFYLTEVQAVRLQIFPPALTYDLYKSQVIYSAIQIKLK